MKCKFESKCSMQSPLLRPRRMQNQIAIVFTLIPWNHTRTNVGIDASIGGMWFMFKPIKKSRYHIFL